MSEPIPEFALLGHPNSYAHLCDILLHSRPDYDREKLRKYEATLRKFFEWTPSYRVPQTLRIEVDDQRTNGVLIICPFLPEAIQSPQQMLMAYRKTTDGCKIAKALGAKVVGLGGFTSIVSSAQGDKLANDIGIAVTSGNTLTAALAVAQLKSILERLEWGLANRTVAVLGASGDIGRACTLALAPHAHRIIAIGRSQGKLEAIRGELHPFDLHISTQPADALQADIILAATSSPQPIIDEADLKPGTIVCDIGYPKNLAYGSDPRSDVLVISAGLAQIPAEFDISYYNQLPTPSIMYGCFSEAMVLALHHRYENYSVGQGRITLDKMDEILGMAQAKGFVPAPPYRGYTPIDDAWLANFQREAAQLQS